MISFKGYAYPKGVILQAVRWYLAYTLSYRDIEEMQLERGINVDHSTLNRWVLHLALLYTKEQLSRSQPGRLCRHDT